MVKMVLVKSFSSPHLAELDDLVNDFKRQKKVIASQVFHVSSFGSAVLFTMTLFYEEETN